MHIAFIKSGESSNIALIEGFDTIVIDIPSRSIHLDISDDELTKRREKQLTRGKMAFKPISRERYVSQALRAYAALTTSADTGAVRDVGQVE